MNFPPLYECSQCGRPVEIIVQGDGIEPIKKFSCTHTDAVIWANRKVVLYGEGNILTRQYRKVKLNIRQALSWLTGRSI